MTQAKKQKTVDIQLNMGDDIHEKMSKPGAKMRDCAQCKCTTHMIGMLGKTSDNKKGNGNNSISFCYHGSILTSSGGSSAIKRINAGNQSFGPLNSVWRSSLIFVSIKLKISKCKVHAFVRI